MKILSATSGAVTFHHSMTEGLSLDYLGPKQYWKMVVPDGVNFDLQTKIWTLETNQLTQKWLSLKKFEVLIDYQIPGQRPWPFILDFSKALIGA